MDRYDFISLLSNIADIGLSAADFEKDSYIRNLNQAIGLYADYKPKRYNDKYKHAMINCLLSQNGEKGEKLASLLSGLREINDVYYDINTPQASDEDMEANIYGRKVGRENKNKDCSEMVEKRYHR